MNDCDALTEEGIADALAQANTPACLIYKEQTESTNDDARQLAKKGAPEYTCIVAASQTKGRGRRGRRFYAPQHTGIYLSLLLRPKVSDSVLPPLTCVAAVAVCRAIEVICGVRPLIKWVNDIYLDERKVGGILTEGVIDTTTGHLVSAVVGIGINVYPPVGGFPEAIQKRAGALCEIRQFGLLNALTARIIDACIREYTSEDVSACLAAYREHMMLPRRRVTVFGGIYDCQEVTVCGVDDNFRLVIRTDTGLVDTLASEEVSLAPSSPL